MKFILRAGLVLSAVALGACAAGSSALPTGTTKIDPSFQGAGLVWRGESAETLLFFKARENQGMVEVCGAIQTFGPALYQSGELEVLQGKYLQIDGKTIANRLTYFSRLPRQTGEPNFELAEGSSANCAITGAAWQPGYERAKIDMVLRSRSAQL